MTGVVRRWRRRFPCRRSPLARRRRAAGLLRQLLPARSRSRARSDGFRIMALPADSAGPIFHKGDHRREVEGVMPRPRPAAGAWRKGRCRGRHCRYIRPSAWPGRPYRPRSPQGRCTSPRASGRVLPCLKADQFRQHLHIVVDELAEFPIITRAALRVGGKPHAICASAALAMAASSSAGVASARGRSLRRWPGYRRLKRPEVPLDHLCR